MIEFSKTLKIDSNINDNYAFIEVKSIQTLDNLPTNSTIYCSVLFVLLMYMEIITELNNVSDRIKAYLDDPQWPEHIKDPQ